MPALSALNMRLRDDYVVDTQAGVNRWNRVFERGGIDFRITLPHVAFHRHIGEFARLRADVDGTLLTEAAWAAKQAALLPSTEDNLFIAGLMTAVRERGAYASWIAPPRQGIDNRPGDFEYVKIEG